MSLRLTRCRRSVPGNEPVRTNCQQSSTVQPITVPALNGGTLSVAKLGQMPSPIAGDEKHACKGMNSCKGQGGCASSDMGCKAKNTCKGKGGCKTNM